MFRSYQSLGPVLASWLPILYNLTYILVDTISLHNKESKGMFIVVDEGGHPEALFDKDVITSNMCTTHETPSDRINDLLDARYNEVLSKCQGLLVLCPFSI